MRRAPRLVALTVSTVLVSALAVAIRVPGAAADPPESGPGSLRTGFADGGTWNGGFNADEALDSVVVQPDGKIVTAFYRQGGGMTIVRLDADGTVDSGWNDNEFKLWSQATVPAVAHGPVGAIAQDSVGRTYVTSAVLVGFEIVTPQVAVLRLTADGALDETWGTNGVVTIDYGTIGPNDHGTSLAFDAATNRMYVGAWVGPDGNTDFGVAALDVSTGSLATGFSGDGIATADFNGGDDTVRDIALMPDGDVLAVGYVKKSDSSEDDVGAWRLAQDGTARATFGDGGTVQYDVADGSNDGARSVTVDDGRIFLSLRDEGNESVTGGVLELTGEGTVDPNFGRAASPEGTGLFLTRFGDSGDNAGITTDSAGRVLVVGGAGVPTVARLVDDRFPEDTSFASTGLETLQCPADSAFGAAQAVTTQSDGTILVAGTCSAGELFNVPMVWALHGGYEVPLATPPVGGGDPDGPDFAVLTASNIAVDGESTRSVTARPGQALDLAFDWDIAAGGEGVYCPDCIDQVVAGFVNSGPEVCVEAGLPQVSGGEGTLAGSIDAPNRPGRYYLAFAKVFEFACSGEGSGTWDGAGRPWASSAAPGPPTYLVAVDVLESSVSGATLTADRATVPPGHRIIPVDDISLDDLTGSLSNLQAAPLRASPLRASPLRASPLRASPLRASPLRASPLRASPLRASPLRASPIPLSQVPLEPPARWTDVLAGTIYAAQPLQNVTLQQVLDLTPVPPTVAALSLADLDITRTPLRNVSLLAFLLGNTPAATLGLTGLPAGVGTSSLVELELSGADLSAVYGQGIHVRGKTLVDAPLRSIRLGDMWLAQTPLGDVPLSVLPAAWYTCTPIVGNPCSTLADAQRRDVDTAIKDVATVGALLALPGLPASVDPTLGQLLPGLVAREQLGYEQLSIAKLAAAAPRPSSGSVTYTAQFTVDCTEAPGPLTVTFALPDGFRAIPSTADLSVPGSGGVSLTHSLVEGGIELAGTFEDCGGVHDAVASVQAEPGIALGPTTDSATITFGEDETSADDAAPVTVVDVTEPTELPLRDDEPASTVFLGYVSSPGDQDAYDLPALEPGSTLTLRLSHVTPGHDFDLSAFGPGLPDLRSAPLRASPLRASPLRASAVDDTTLDPSSDAGTVPTEPQPDVPVQPPAGSTVLGISANRGAADESLLYRVPDGVTSGDTRIVVSGYNGSTDTTSAYALLVAITPPATPPPCAPPMFAHPGDGSAGPLLGAGSLPAGTQTLILTDRKRLGDIYGATAASSVMGKLNALAARSDVAGVVVSVEADPDVAAAYAAWDDSSCSPARANAVVAAINDYVDRVRGGYRNLKYLVIAGGDQVVPMGRVPDRMDLDNESGFADDQVYNGHDNALSGSLRAGFVLSDDPYADVNPIAWLDGQAYVPDMALGRLVETPADITKAVDQYVASNGVRSPNTAYTAGYDFNADGAQLVANTLAGRVPAGASTATINSTWSSVDAVNGLKAAAHGYASVNAHYDAYRALPANEFSGGTQNQLLHTTDLPADLSGGVLFTIGCHAGLSVADTFVATPAEAAKKADWTQAVASRGAVYAANTGYGYGDSVAVAYSERLMADLAKNLDATMTVGQALMLAKQSSVRLPLSVADVKVMEEATFYGLPMYRLGASGASAAAVVPAVPAVPEIPTTSAGPPQSLSLTGTGRTLTRQDTGRGTWYAVTSGGTTQAPLTIPGRPIEPETTDSYAQPTSSQRAHGVVIDALTTRLTSESGGFDPVYSAATPDSSTTTPEPASVGAFFPATLAGVVERATPQGLRDVVVLHPGQFRSASPNAALGFQQLADSVGYHLVYSDAADVTPAAIGTVTGTVDSGQITFHVTTPDNDAISATAMFLARSGTSAQAWTAVPLTPSDAHHTFTGSAPVSTSTVEQYFIQLLDNANNVSVSSKKGQDFSAPHEPSSPTAPVITVDGTATAGKYVGPQQVTITADGPVTYTLGAGTAEHTYAGPFTVSGLGDHTVTATSGGESSSLTFTIAEPPGPAVTIANPSATTSYSEGDTITAVFACTGYQVTSCVPSPATPDNTLGSHTFSVTATDVRGKVGSASVTYTVRHSPFDGLLQPVDDPAVPTPSVFKRNSTVPLKFRLVDSAGNPIPDAVAGALAARCDLTVSYSRLGSSTAPVDESVFTLAADSGGCFRYGGSQFIYNLGTKPLVAGSIYLLRIHSESAFVADHTVRIAVR